jgi:hypothetical protein
MDVKESIKIKDYTRSNFKVGMWVVDSEGNEFKITEIRENKDVFMWDAVSLWSPRGEIEIASGDLRFYTIRGGNMRERELKNESD